MRENFQISGSYNNQRYTNIDGERTVNLFEYIDPLGKKDKSLLSTSGLTDTGTAFTSVTTGFRGQFVYNNNIFQVIGSKVFKIDSSLNISTIGTINTVEGRVRIDGNTTQVIFVDGTDGWIYDFHNFMKITDTSFPNDPIDVCYLDGFFTVPQGGTNIFRLSKFDQGMMWGGFSSIFTANGVTNIITMANTENFATGVDVTVTSTMALPTPLVADTNYYVIQLSGTTLKLASTYQNAISNIPIIIISNGSGTLTMTNNGQIQEGEITTHPGNIVGCRTLHRRLFLFSQNYTEVWENAGIGTALPFRRNNSLLMEVGTPSNGSIAVNFDRMFFLAQDSGGLSSVMQVVGTQPIPISNRALDFALAQYASNPSTQGVSDATSILVKENGIIFYRLNFTKANHTYVYNVSMSDLENPRWHEEEVLNGDRHPADTHAYFNGINYYGSYNHPILYIVDYNNSTNNGQPIRRMRITRPVMPSNANRTRIDRLQIDFIEGNFSNIPDLQPYVFLSISKDGGQTYGNKIAEKMGKVGKYTSRVVFRKLGVIPRGQGFIIKLETFDNINIIILGAVWDYEILPE